MKPIVISSCLALAALSLFAQSSTGTVSPVLTRQTLLSSPQSIGIGDSPLVRAAKASNRLGKKPSQVITNDTLIRQGGHFTTTTPEAQLALPSVKPPGGPTPEQLAADAKKKKTETAAAAEKHKKDAEAKRNAAALRAAAAEGDTPEAIYDEPPALEPAPGTLSVVKPSTPATMGQPQKPPM